MLVDTLKTLYRRDLDRLRNEIEQYKKEENLWKVEGFIANSAGNLCLHLLGNLNTYIGKEIGSTSYERNRDLEFSAKGLSRKQLLEGIDGTMEVVDQSLGNLDEPSLTKEYLILVFEQPTATEYLLVHLTTHLAYHLSQINYHRRVLDK